ncbi:hypothetical protein EV361DRAFT_84384 [Lentinula raphanica]|nr:hypothetical protein EV361DRAFT_84384 [Lentinula raphanica]
MSPYVVRVDFRGTSCLPLCFFPLAMTRTMDKSNREVTQKLKSETASCCLATFGPNSPGDTTRFSLIRRREGRQWVSRGEADSGVNQTKKALHGERNKHSRRGEGPRSTAGGAPARTRYCSKPWPNPLPGLKMSKSWRVVSGVHSTFLPSDTGHKHP